MRKLLALLALAASLSLATASTCTAQGVLRVALGTTLSQLDPAKTTIGDEYVYVHLVFNGLSRIDPDMTVKPDLAESWTRVGGPEDLDVQAAPGRQVPPRPRARRRGRGRHHEAHSRPGHRLARAHQPVDGRKCRDGRCADGEVRSQHSRMRASPTSSRTGSCASCRRTSSASSRPIRSGPVRSCSSPGRPATGWSWSRIPITSKRDCPSSTA